MIDRIFAVAHFADQAVLILLLGLTAMAVYLILDRALFLKKLKKQSQKVKDEIQQALLTQRYDYVETLALQSEHFIGRNLAVALQHYHKMGASGLDELFRSLVLLEKPRMERSLGFLATVGSNAPYIGLFGTVLGIMKSFHELGQSSQAGQNTVMAGISAALVATAAGLLVAIPAVLAFNYFQKQVKGVLSVFDSAQELFILYVKQNEVNRGRAK